MEERRPQSLELIVIAGLTVLFLLPFWGKPFHIDDPLFIWSAKQILLSPLDFYGFSLVWYDLGAPMHAVMKNPPLASYYMALVGALFGFGERAMHLAMLVPAIATTTGTYMIATKLTKRPFLAGLISLFTPLLLVSGTTVMCDILMLAFWCWAIYFWLRASDEKKGFYILISVIFISLAVMTKYFAVSLIPLLIAYSLYSKMAIKKWAPYILLIFVVIVLYQLATRSLYGVGLFTDAFSYASEARAIVGRSFITRGFTGLVFTGGCLITALFFAPWLWGRRVMALGVILALAASIVIVIAGGFDKALVATKNGTDWRLIIHFFFFALAGLSILALTVRDFLRDRSPEALLLLFWVGGIFVFAAFLNWTTNARSLLPIAPALGILIARSIDSRLKETGKSFRMTKKYTPLIYLPLVPALIISLMVSIADYRHAASVKVAAKEITRRYFEEEKNIWFLGHWGFHYYMEEFGARPIEKETSPIRRGDVIVKPQNNTNPRPLPEGKSEDVALLIYPSSRFLSTMTKFAFSGFYASEWGPLPYVFGPSYQEGYVVAVATRDIWAGD